MSYYTPSALRLGHALSPARRANVHSSHSSRQVLARFQGTLYLFNRSVSSRSRPCSLSPSRHYPRRRLIRVVSYRPASYRPRVTRFVSPAPMRATHTHTHSLSPSSPPFFFCALAFLSGSRPALDHPAGTRLTTTTAGGMPEPVFCRSHPLARLILRSGGPSVSPMLRRLPCDHGKAPEHLPFDTQLQLSTFQGREDLSNLL